MHAYQISIVGLIIDVIGAFLLSVEAIKPHNLRYFCDRVLRKVHHETLSPSILIEGEEPPKDFVVNWASRHVGLFTALHYLAGMLLLALADLLSAGWLHRLAGSAVGMVLTLEWYWVVFAALAAALFGGVAGLWMLGELVHIGIVFLLKRLIAALEFIQERYADGTVGIIGFVLLFIGFALQAVGTYWGRPFIP